MDAQPVETFAQISPLPHVHRPARYPEYPRDLFNGAALRYIDQCQRFRSNVHRLARSGALVQFPPLIAADFHDPPPQPAAYQENSKS
jgi:hypothetical protein